MKHAFKEFRILSAFQFGGRVYEKHSEQFAKPLEGEDRQLVVFSDPNELVDIVSGQSKLKPGVALLAYDGTVVGHVPGGSQP